MQAAERARSLLAINNAVVLNLTRDALFQAITEALRPVVPFDRSTIFLYDDHRQVLRLVVAESAIPSDLFIPGLELPLEGSHAGWAFLNQRVFFRPDLAKERQYEGEAVLLREGFRSLVVVPLVVRGKSIGTLNLGSLKPMQYGAAEAELLREVANQLALAIENMREYEEIGRLKAQLERENVYLREEITDQHNFKEIVGNSPALLAALRTIDRVAPTDTTVLDPWRNRHREGTGGARHPQPQPASHASAREGQLRRDPGRADRKRAIWTCPGRLHRRARSPSGTLRTGRRRHAVPRRSR